MERRNRDRYDRNDYGHDYDRYDNYNPRDEHYHSARNLTNEFERDYRRERGDWNDDRDRSHRQRSYHEGSMGNDYDRNRRDDSNYRRHSNEQWNDQDRNRNFSNNFSSDRDRLNNYQDDFRGNQDTYRSSRNQDWERNEDLRGNIRQGYGISSFGGTSDRYNTLNSDQNRSGAGDDQVYNSGDRDGYQSSRFGGGMGDSFPSSHNGVPDTTYGVRNFGDEYGTGMGSTYGGRNYGGGTGYMSGHRGGTLGSSSYGTVSGNFGGYGPMGGSTYGGGRGSSTGSTSHNSNRGVRESGGF